MTSQKDEKARLEPATLLNQENQPVASGRAHFLEHGTVGRFYPPPATQIPKHRPLSSLKSLSMSGKVYGVANVKLCRLRVPKGCDEPQYHYHFDVLS